MLSPLAMSAIGAILGLFLFCAAWRGRRIDDHPICRRCGFDLIGRPLDAENCSECGANLTRRRAISMGHRKRRPIWIALIILFILIPAGGQLVRHGWRAASAVDYTPYKPSSWLLSDVRRNVLSRRDRSVMELTKRMRAEKLSESQKRQVIDLLLKAQADTTRAWDAYFGSAIEEQYERGTLSEEDWRAYWEDAFVLESLPGGRHYIDPGKISVLYQPQRHSTRMWEVTFRVSQWSIDGTDLPLPLIAEQTSLSSYRTHASPTNPLYIRSDVPQIRGIIPFFGQMENGPHSASCTLEVQLRRDAAFEQKRFKFRLNLGASFYKTSPHQPTTAAANR